MSRILYSSLIGVLACSLCSVLVACSTAPTGADLAPETATVAVIVQGRDLSAVAEAVRQVGGEITHELGIIRAAGAELTAAQRAALEQHAAVTRIYEDRKVAVDSAPALTVRDELNSASFTNDDGTASWEGGWIENDVQGAGPTSGQVQIVGGELHRPGPRSGHRRGGRAPGWRRDHPRARDHRRRGSAVDPGSVANPACLARAHPS